MKDFTLNLRNFIKRYLIYFPFERGSKFNGNILKHFHFHQRQKESVCIFSHFDKDGIVDDYVLNYLDKILEQGFDIVFVSTAKNLGSEETKKLKNLCIDVIIKENIGYDFGAWKTGIDYLGVNIDKYESLLLCNDSVYAPLFPLSEMFGQMQECQYDFWGITDSHEIYHHLQSYFMVFDKKLVSSDIFKNIWKTYKVYKIKRNIILNYEVGLSQKLIDHGYSMGAYCQYNKLIGSRVVNASRYYWKELIEKFRCPILKVELLRDNPRNIDISNLEEVIENETNFEVDLIKQHLNRIKN